MAQSNVYFELSDGEFQNVFCYDEGESDAFFNDLSHSIEGAVFSNGYSVVGIVYKGLPLSYRINENQIEYITKSNNGEYIIKTALITAE